MIVKDNQEEFQNYLFDASNFKGFSSKLYIPENIQELKNLIKICNTNKTPVNISAIRTGLTGAAVPLGELIISLEKFDKIINIDTNTKTVKLQPCVTVRTLQEEISRFNLFYAPNPTETNSSIGGNVATNASGAKSFKYGSTRNFIKSLKLILANGEETTIKRGEYIENSGYIYWDKIDEPIPIKNIKMPTIKHAAGYYIKPGMDLIDLFIGSEGTLAIVEEIELSVINAPEKVLGGIIFFDDLNKLFDFVDSVRNQSKENFQKQSKDNLEARLIEFFDDKSLNLLRQKYNTIPEKCVGAIWFEQEYSEDNEDEILFMWNDIIKKHTKYYNESWFAIDEKSHQKLTEFRHELPLMVFEIINKNNSFKIGTDTAVPDEFLRNYYNFLKNILHQSGLTYFTWGHIGNSHFHANIITSNQQEYKLAEKIYYEIIDKAILLNGTVSAEHGIGKLKKPFFRRLYNRTTINYMMKVKRIFDKNLILNPQNLFDFKLKP